MPGGGDNENKEGGAKLRLETVENLCLRVSYVF